MSASVLPFVAAVVAALGAYLAASRKLSGKIGTSEASSLWTESASIRDDYREQINVDRERIARLEARVAEAEQTNLALARENVGLSAEVQACKRESADLHSRIATLEGENAALKRTIQRMAGDA